MRIHGCTKEVTFVNDYGHMGIDVLYLFGWVGGKKLTERNIGFFVLFWFAFGAAYSCSMELCLNSDSDKKMRYLEYFMHRINLLRHHKITPVVVFDGGSIPLKAATEEGRHRHVQNVTFRLFYITQSVHLFIL